MFELRASALGRVGVARMQVLMNRPPWGGSFKLEYVEPAVALQTDVTLTALQWFDDPTDLPITYSFGYFDEGGSVNSKTLLTRSIAA